MVAGRIPSAGARSSRAGPARDIPAGWRTCEFFFIDAPGTRVFVQEMLPAPDPPA